MRGNWGKTYLKISVLLVIVAGVFSGFLLVRNTQLLSSSALTPPSVGNVEVNVGDPKDGVVRVDLKFRTGLENGQDEAVSTVAFRLSVKSKTNGNVSLVDADGNTAEKMSPGDKISTDNNWEVPLNLVNNVGSGFTTEFIAVNKSKNGYTSVDPEVLVSFFVKGLSGKSDIGLEFDKDSSVMYSKRRPVTNIWSI